MKLMTTREAADQLGVTDRYIRHMCANGVMGLRVGGRWLLTGGDLKRYRKNHRGPGRPPA